MTTFPPTDEQVAAMRTVAEGEHTAIEALAGTGKTTTLRFIAGAQPQTRITYVAFNRAIVNEAKETMPSNATAATAHSLAYRAVGHRFRHRLQGGRMRSEDIARKLDLRKMVLETDHGTRVLAAGWLAGTVIRALKRFATTADEKPTSRHVPHLDGIDAEGEWTYTRQIGEALQPALEAAWSDITSEAGTLPFDHNYYLKLWQLGRPRIPTEIVLYDEAQDANAAMLAVINGQDAQRVFVGDRYQQIYEWNGAVNAMSNVDVTRRTWLTNSFRFGPEIAGYANRILGILEAPATLIGRGRPGTVGYLEADEDPDAYLTRTNAGAVIRALTELAAGGRPALVGGADPVIWFAKAAVDLQAGRPSSHPDLACFVDWHQVIAYTEEDQLGGELKLLVNLVEEFGAQRIIDGLSRTVPEDEATIVISTAHKAKGRQWDRVQLADDFPEDRGDEENRLLYVAATRAQIHLDAEAVAIVPSTLETGSSGSEEPAEPATKKP